MTEQNSAPDAGNDAGGTHETAQRRTAPSGSGRGHVLREHPIRVVLIGVVIGAVAMAVTAVSLGWFSTAGDVGGTNIGENERLAQNAFTESVAGDCLNWPDGNPGSPEKVDCTAQHRFEVAGPIDGTVLPGAEFGTKAAWPGVARFAAIRDEQCPVMVSEYLGGKLDPQGRFSVGLMFPSQVQWDKGARQLRCGLEQPGRDGVQTQFSGKVSNVDQSFDWPPGTCIGIDTATRKPTSTVVNCTEKHSFQTTGVIDLGARFGPRLSGKPWPGIDEQNKFLGSICPGQTNRFLGGKDKFDKTTLNVQWSTVSEVSWLAGSRRVVCYIGLPDDGGFATLVGDARSTLLINGKLPVPPPAAPPGRALPTPVPQAPGIAPNPQEVPAPAGGG
ncbi:septum formation family protein [Gordonia sp. TBRC 11910]|uniref:Septum formation family protein n=1 Tax=Gordonia asplenii TaxID=2725283 RepID=A0A848L0Y3_9ACTN|nr:septum formation family protein [Gordonia asplenii]NMO04359.1 septum formation family protein [Gordonia asplenii]